MSRPMPRPITRPGKPIIRPPSVKPVPPVLSPQIKPDKFPITVPKKEPIRLVKPSDPSVPIGIPAPRKP
ncbi:hypothetical protein TVAG_135890 [Trichomonas vaginalis G3]|uniref:Uncharacterized protein n=1 Tax=Trichomonas vaginalis (strain ATCC PRA-98 / G3) TaxID=412133 RepID=A2DJ71_TRIV3|nr:hypothetical protein TVAGG3_0544240 [Trichomonas vaginalis G3]EAY19458.1 hypothetical protein TVAG_135890 [Trichomonas vaginalis G3]KAI5520063.1 hypothetical protein TVAGG3_0544240 [Trichomonas vaginalis G3]|eukprot:XP_001580444.1 hypothetical protein [Trichomonas vaginalis G3]